MSSSLDQFIKHLEESGVLDGGTLKEFVPPKASHQHADDLIKDLVQRNKLTPFQAQEVSNGNGKTLVLGNYLLLEKIGQGGMGQVFKAEHRRMHRVVAVKVLPASTMKDPATIARFEREVTAAAKLEHPNIVAAHDADCANGIHFLVMQYVEGQDLSALVKKNGPFSVEKAVNYTLQAARGLEAAHAEGIIHRDIKPSNLLLDKKGTVKILDMGLARIESAGADVETQSELTGTGAVMGTVDYMAPEQAISTKSADARADIYSLGCSLFYLLTGKAAYAGETITAKLIAHQNHPIPALRKACIEASAELETVFNRMMAKKIEDRYQTMSEVIADLERLAPAPQASASTPHSGSTNLGTATSTLLHDAQSAPTLLQTTTERIPVRSGKRNKTFIVGAAVLGLAILAGIIVTLKTEEGNLIVEVDQPDAMVQVLDTEGKIEVSQKGGGGKVSISVDPGKHRLKVEKGGFAIFGAEFEMERSGRKTISAKLVPLEAKTDAVGTVTPKSATVGGGNEKPLFFETPQFDEWVLKVKAMSAEDQIKAVSQKLVELNPGFDGKLLGVEGNGKPEIEKGAVTYLWFFTDNVTDISPVRALTGLRALNCRGTDNANGSLTNLTPLTGMQIVALNCCANPQLVDLSPIRRCPLDWLNVSHTQVRDLSTLSGMKLRFLSCDLTKVVDLSPLLGMKLGTFRCVGTSVTNLSPLRGMPLQVLNLESTLVTDLSPVKECPIKHFSCIGTQISDLSPIKDMPLTWVQLDFKPYRDTELLRSIKTLETIEGKSAAEFWKEAEAKQAAFDQWAKDVAAMPAEQQVEAVRKKLVELNPRFNGKIQDTAGQVQSPKIQDGVVVTFGFCTDNVTDISPVRALKTLKSLSCTGSAYKKGILGDLSPLNGMHLERLAVGNNPAVVDLSPLSGMFVTVTGKEYFGIEFHGTGVRDLSPLKGMGLKFLYAQDCQAADLSPLKGMPLETLSCGYSPAISDISPLSDCKNLKLLNVRSTKVTPAGVAVLQKALPNCKIEWDDPAKSATSSKLFIHDPAFPQWVKNVQAMPAEKQVEAVRQKLMELNPGFDGDVTPTIEDRVVTGLQFVTDNVTDISPVRALAGLKILHCGGSGTGKGGLSDLSPLQGMTIRRLNCGWSPSITDLSPLRGMPLVYLSFGGTNVSDVSPLRGMPLIELWFTEMRVTFDLSPLEDCKSLQDLNITKGKEYQPAAIAALQKSLPNCTISWDDPAKATIPAKQ